MVAEAHDEMEDSHWMASLRSAFSARKECVKGMRNVCGLCECATLG